MRGAQDGLRFANPYKGRGLTGAWPHPKSCGRDERGTVFEANGIPIL